MDTALEMSLDDILEVAATEDPIEEFLEDDFRRAELFECQNQIRHGDGVVTSLDSLKYSPKLSDRLAYSESLTTSMMAEEEIVLAIMTEEFEKILHC